MHLSRSQEMFNAIGESFVAVMERHGEAKFAAWFKEQYLTAPWDTWWVGASGLPGLLPNNNPVRHCDHDSDSVRC